jgi:hypothetical protein
MLNFAEGMVTVVLGVLIVIAPSPYAPFSGVGGPTSVFDRRPNVPVAFGSCEPLGSGGVMVRCKIPDDYAHLGASPAPTPAPQDPTRPNAIVMGPDPGGKASKEGGDQDRGGAKPTSSTSPSPTPSPNPREEESRQKRSDNSRPQEDCDGPASAARIHYCLVYLKLRPG